MVEKIIYDKNVIYKLTRRDDDLLIIKYNIKNKRAWFQTDSMIKRKAIDINRVVNLQFFFPYYIYILIKNSQKTPKNKKYMQNIQKNIDFL